MGSVWADVNVVGLDERFVNDAGRSQAWRDDLDENMRVIRDGLPGRSCRSYGTRLTPRRIEDGHSFIPSQSSKNIVPKM